MQYPFRVEVYFNETLDKFKMIQKINRFMLHEVSGDYKKVNINQRRDNAFYSEFVGVEVMFANHADAVLFKLGFEDNGERIQSKILPDHRKEEKGI